MFQFTVKYAIPLCYFWDNHARPVVRMLTHVLNQFGAKHRRGIALCAVKFPMPMPRSEMTTC